MTTIHNALSYFYQLYLICTGARANVFPLTNTATKALWYRTAPRGMKKGSSVSKVLKNKKFPGHIPSLEVAASGSCQEVPAHLCSHQALWPHLCYPKMRDFSPKKHSQGQEGALDTAELGLCSPWTERPTWSLPLRNTSLKPRGKREFPWAHTPKYL